MNTNTCAQVNTMYETGKVYNRPCIAVIKMLATMWQSGKTGFQGATGPFCLCCEISRSLSTVVTATKLFHF